MPRSARSPFFHWPATGLELPRISNELAKAWLLSDPGQALAVAGGNGERVVQLPHCASDVMVTVVVETGGDHAITTAQAA